MKVYYTKGIINFGTWKNPDFMNFRYAYWIFPFGNDI